MYKKHFLPGIAKLLSIYSLTGSITQLLWQFQKLENSWVLGIENDLSTLCLRRHEEEMWRPEWAHSRGARDPVTSHAHSLAQDKKQSGDQGLWPDPRSPQKNQLALKTAANKAILHLVTLPPHSQGSRGSCAEQASPVSRCTCPSVLPRKAGPPSLSGLCAGLAQAQPACGGHGPHVPRGGPDFNYAAKTNLGEDIGLPGWDPFIL